MAEAVVTQLPLGRTTRRKPTQAPAQNTAHRPRHWSLREKLTAGFGTACGLVAVAVTALSLADLAEAIGQVAHLSGWRAYALAVGIDANFLSVEGLTLFASAAALRAARWTTLATKVITLALSAAANSFAMAAQAETTVMVAACIVLGCAIPGLIALSSHTLGSIVRTR